MAQQQVSAIEVSKTIEAEQEINVVEQEEETGILVVSENAESEAVSGSSTAPPPPSPLDLTQQEQAEKTQETKSSEPNSAETKSALGRALKRLENTKKVFKPSPSSDFPARHNEDAVEAHFALAADRTRAVSSGLIGMAAGAKMKGAAALPPANAKDINTANELVLVQAQKVGYDFERHN